MLLPSDSSVFHVSAPWPCCALLSCLHTSPFGFPVLLLSLTIIKFFLSRVGHHSSHSVLWWFHQWFDSWCTETTLFCGKHFLIWSVCCPYLKPGCHRSRMILFMHLQRIWPNGIIFSSSQGLLRAAEAQSVLRINWYVLAFCLAWPGEADSILEIFSYGCRKLLLQCFPKSGPGTKQIFL